MTIHLRRAAGRLAPSRAGIAFVLFAVLTALLIPVASAQALVVSTPIVTDSPDHGAGFIGRVNDIAEANGLVYIVGDFTQVGGQTRNYAAAIDPATGRVDADWNPNLNGTAFSVDVAPDGSAVYVGGQFTKVGATWVRRIAKLDPQTGQPVANWNPKASSRVETVQATADTVFIGGSFTATGDGVPRNRLAAIDAATGVIDPSWNPGAGGTVLTSVLSDDGATLYVGGNFDTLGGVARPHLGAVDTATGAVSGWNPAPPHKVLDAELSVDEATLFTAIGGPQAEGGNLATAYETDSGAVVWNHSSDGDFQAVAAAADAVYYGGHFVTIEGSSRQRLAAFDPDSGSLLGWNPGANSAWGVWALTYTDRLYVGGDFSTIGGRTQEHFATFTNGENQPPTALFSVGCAQLSCQFDGSGSVDPDGVIVSHEWDFGDGATATGATPAHVYGAAGAYTVTLTVTDDDGATSTHADGVSVTEGSDGIDLVGVAGSVKNASSHTVTVPAAVNPQDGLLLFATVNSASDTVNEPTGVTGWTRLGTIVDESMQTVVWSKAADPGDAGSNLTITLSSLKKTNVSLLAYTGTDPNDPVHAWAGAPESVNRATHTTPQVATTVDGAWIVSYWADKTSSTTDWTPPAGELVRRESIGTGGGRVSVLATDTGQSHPAGTYGSTNATASSSNSKATMVTVALNPVVETTNQRPTAAFTSSCDDLSCSFDAATSFDSDGSIESYDWAYGDGSTGSEETSAHIYGAYQTYPVTLTVTDNKGATDAISQDVHVTNPNAAAIAFVGSNSAYRNSRDHQVTIPAGVQSGDSLVLFFSANSETTTVDDPAGVAGWTRLDQVSSDTMQTIAWAKTAAAGDAGSTLTVTLSNRKKGTLIVAAYSGTDPTAPIHTIAAAAETTKRSNHTTPQVTTTIDGTWIVSYWADKTSATTDWTLPTGETMRDEVYGSGGGRVTSILSDTSAPQAPGTYGGVTATANSANVKATMWTLALRPAS